mgnify:CR=1 FL=1
MTTHQAPNPENAESRQRATKLPQERQGVCDVCGRHTVILYDGRFDAEVCQVCDGLLTIRDDEFRRTHPEHDSTIRTIWRDRFDPANARTIGLLYYDMGYWAEQEADDRAFEAAMASQAQASFETDEE